MDRAPVGVLYTARCAWRLTARCRSLSTQRPRAVLKLAKRNLYVHHYTEVHGAGGHGRSGGDDPGACGRIRASGCDGAAGDGTVHRAYLGVPFSLAFLLYTLGEESLDTGARHRPTHRAHSARHHSILQRPSSCVLTPRHYPNGTHDHRRSRRTRPVSPTRQHRRIDSPLEASVASTRSPSCRGRHDR